MALANTNQAQKETKLSVPLVEALLTSFYIGSLLYLLLTVIG